MRGPGCTTETPCMRGLWPLADAPGAAGDEVGAGDGVAGFEGFFDGGFVGLAGGLDGEPLRGEGVFVVDLDGLGLAGGELVIGKREPGGGGLELGEDEDEGLLEGIGPGFFAAGQFHQSLGLLLAVGGLTAEVLDHPAVGIGLGVEGLPMPLLLQQGGFQLSDGLGAELWIVAVELLSQTGDTGGEFLVLDAQLPEPRRGGP